MSKHVISATDLSRTLSAILNRVLYQGQDFEIKRGKEIIARIIPVEPHKHKLKLGNLKEFLDRLPALDKDDRQAFFADIKSMHSKMKHEENPWD